MGYSQPAATGAVGDAHEIASMPAAQSAWEGGLAHLSVPATPPPGGCAVDGNAADGVGRRLLHLGRQQLIITRQALQPANT